MDTVRIIIIILASVVGLIIFISFNFARFLVLPIKLRHNWVIGIEEKKGLMSIQWYRDLVKEEVNLISPHGYKLYGELVMNPIPTNKTVVIVHGYRFNFIGSIKYGKMLLDMGYNVLWYDNCNSGRSSGIIVTMGYREKDDLGVFVKFIRDKFNGSHKIGIHGESMGASLSIMYGATDSGLSFIIEDCGYSNLRQELTHHLRTKFHMPVILILPLAALFVRLIARFKIDDVNPLKLLGEDNELARIPMLFIHGDKDGFTPTTMAYDMYNEKRGEKYIYICKGANHAESFKKDREKYYNVVRDFIDKTDFN